jgi:2-polyprenyl-6-methoxyphenol hydroxylase-like FAD-dependent oxidoreductase
MHHFPEGLLPIGDAICSLNPLYGQGMSVAALQVQALGKLLAERDGRPSPLDGLWRDFLPRAARTAKNAWTLACGQDFQYPETVGRRPRFFSAQRWLAGRLQELTGTDPEAAQQFGRVIQLLDPPSALFRPRLVLRAFFSFPRSNGSRG